MKKRYVVIIIIVIVIATLSFVWFYFTNHRTVTFTMKTVDTSDSYTVKISTSDGKKVTEISSPNAEVQLWKGDYKYNVVSNKYESSDHDFSVNNSDQSLTIEPSYSKKYLTGLLTSEVSEAIIGSLQPYLSKVPSTDYSIESLQLYGHGEWAAGKISYQPSTSEPAEVYRFILSKSEGDWKVVAQPQIAVYSTDHKDVPRYIIDSLY